MTRVLVTGGAGFIGSHLVDRLLKDNHDVFILDDLSGGKEENVSQNVGGSCIDLRNEREVGKAIRDIKPEIIYHLAANAAENKAQFSPIDITSRNYSAFINTLQFITTCPSILEDNEKVLSLRRDIQQRLLEINILHRTGQIQGKYNVGMKDPDDIDSLTKYQELVKFLEGKNLKKIVDVGAKEIIKYYLCTTIFDYLISKLLNGFKRHTEYATIIFQ